MKIKLESSQTAGGHGVARIFKTSEASEATKAKNVIGTVSASGEVKFIDTPEAQSIAKKIESFKVSGMKYGFSRIKHNGKVMPGCIYLDIVNPEYEVSYDALTESEELIDTEDNSFQSQINRILLSEHAGAIISEDVVPNVIDLVTNEPIALFGEPKAEFGIDTKPVYASKDAIFEKDEKRIVGEYDPGSHTIIFTDEEFVERINTLVEEGFKFEFSVARMFKRDGFYITTEAGEWNLTKFFTVEDDDEYLDDAVKAAFLNDEAPEEIEEATVQVDGITGQTDMPQILNDYVKAFGKKEKQKPEQEQSLMNQYISWAQRY